MTAAKCDVTYVPHLEEGVGLGRAGGGSQTVSQQLCFLHL